MHWYCWCPDCSQDDVRYARDVLEFMLGELPVRAKVELAQVVRVLDREFRRRSLPDPYGDHRGRHRDEAWWWHRLDAERPLM